MYLCFAFQLIIKLQFESSWKCRSEFLYIFSFSRMDTYLALLKTRAFDDVKIYS